MIYQVIYDKNTGAVISQKWIEVFPLDPRRNYVKQGYYPLRVGTGFFGEKLFGFPVDQNNNVLVLTTPASFPEDPNAPVQSIQRIYPAFCDHKAPVLTLDELAGPDKIAVLKNNPFAGFAPKMRVEGNIKPLPDYRYDLASTCIGCGAGMFGPEPYCFKCKK